MSDNMNCGCNFNGVLNLVFPNGDNIGIPGLGYMMPVVKFGARTIVVEETTLAFTKDGSNDWYISGDDPLAGFVKASFELDTLYTITWDGVEYECFYNDLVYFYSGTTIHTCDMIGNSAPLGFSPGYVTDAPFCIVNSWPDEYPHVTVYAFDSTESMHTIKIEKTPYTVKYLPGQFYLSAGSRPMIAPGTGHRSVVEGSARDASGQGSHAEGFGSVASKKYSHAEGAAAMASGNYSHAEGFHATASGISSHAEGSEALASGAYAHAEGAAAKASGMSSHAEGRDSEASGYASHAEGRGTIANHAYQHALGKFNVADPSSAAATAEGNYIEIAGNGTATDARSNARTLDWEGNEILAGGLTLGGSLKIGQTTITEMQLQALLAML